MKKRLLKAIKICSICLVFMGCQKYPDGPEISLRSPEKRLIKTWKLQQIFTDGDLGYVSSPEIFEIRSDNTFINTVEGSSVWKGTWELNSDKDKLTCDGMIHSLLSSDTIGDHYWRSFAILRLKNKSLWFSMSNNYVGPRPPSWKTIEYHYIPD